ncbi:SPOR domain-containing protein [Paenibacillus oceani]|uniref:SPOR domain-containing protein n=1 Tax=Paenibacillus oceani TaxID=2772510 RepID=A0A927C6F1_9BACL|nr:SPOR domain-containing protein [Paenibacillus oceani]MBD2860993.1 SPOR domain-containing protein [Paenibacillus oceani]
MNKARITYRFDETGRETVRKEPNPVIPLSKDEFTVVEEERHVPNPGSREAYDWEQETIVRPARRAPVDVQPLNQFTTDFGAWSSPFDAETERVERTIRESGRTEPPIPPKPSLREERYPIEREERYDGESGYYGPEAEQPEREYPRRERAVPRPVMTRARYERHNRTPWLKIVASVTGAVAVGVAMGFFVLSMFDGDDLKLDGNNGTNATANGSTVPAQTKPPDAGGGAKDGAAPASSASAAAVPANVAAQSYTFLQNGVFSNQQGADTAAAEWKKKGLAAYVHPSDKYYVYVGITQTRGDADALSALLKERDPKVELYPKAVSIPAVSKVKWAGEQAQVGQAEQFFAQGQKLVQSILGFSSGRLKEKSQSPIDDATMQTIATAHQAWIGASGPFGAGLGAEEKAVLQKMTTAMNTAVNSMQEYKKNPSSAYLWQAQSSLMQALILENELLAAIQV